MAMNVLHRWCCRSHAWSIVSGRVLLPWALDGADLGGSVLEIGPGYGANTSFLASRAEAVTAVEIDPGYVEHLRQRHAADQRVRIIEGDATDTGLAAGDYSSVVSMAMLHHVPTEGLQDALFAEARRLLSPGGVFVGGDGTPTPPFALVHVGDTYNPVRPATLPGRLEHAGFVDVRVDTTPGALRFSARAPR
ncbi:class I SAM-dependent methyltransferase [Gordonia sp. NPDC058843]|uniref:class I SAM-dependent methyltransferase n=1 Tax=Gordonia sp. NPDC058843 TaxID=3346648 RepID=UPI00367BF573